MQAARLAFKIERVQQWTDQTCIHACLAMAAGMTSSEMKTFCREHELAGPLGVAGAVMLAGRLGFAALPVPVTGARMALTEGHYIAMVPGRITDGYHAVLLHLFDSGIFRIYDPSKGREYEDCGLDTLPAFQYLALYDFFTLPRPARG